MLLTAHVTDDCKLEYNNGLALVAACSRFKGKPVTIDINEYVGWRSYLQNRYWRGHVVPEVKKGYREKLGIDIIDNNDMHEILVQAFIPETDIVNAKTGEIIGKRRRGTSDMNKIEMMDLIARVQLFGAETLGIYIEDPDKDWKKKRLQAA